MKRPDPSVLTRAERLLADTQRIRDRAIAEHTEADKRSERPGGGGYLYSPEERAWRHADTRERMLKALHALNWHGLDAEAAEFAKAEAAYGSTDAILARARFTEPCESSFEDTRIQAEALEEAKKSAAFRELTMLKSDTALAARIRQAAEDGDLATLHVARLVRDARVQEHGAGKCAQSGAALEGAYQTCDPPPDVQSLREKASALESAMQTAWGIRSSLLTNKPPEQTNRERMLHWKAEAEAEAARTAAAAAPKPTPAPTEPPVTIVPPVSPTDSAV